MKEIINELKNTFIKINVSIINPDNGESYGVPNKDVFINPIYITSIKEVDFHRLINKDIYEQITLTTGERYFVKK